MSNSSRGTISCTRVLAPHSIAPIYQHIHAGVIFQRQRQSPCIFFTYNSKRTRIWRFHAQNKKLYFRSEMAFRMWKCFFVILQVRIPVAGESQETRVESHPLYKQEIKRKEKEHTRTVGDGPKNFYFFKQIISKWTNHNWLFSGCPPRFVNIEVQIINLSFVRIPVAGF